jgi:YD repeat-containing protein
MRCVAWLVACSLLAACSDRRSEAEPAVTVDTIAGVVHVRNPAPASVDSADSRVTIGGVGGDASATPYEFGRVTSATISDDGRIFVADGQAREVRVFSQEGRFLQAFGRQGAGPGEFGALYSMTWLGDSILTLDSNNARISVFTGDGEFVTTWPWLPLTGPVNHVRFYPTAPGEAYVFGIRPVDGGRSIRTFIRLTQLGATDTLEAPPAEESPGNTLVCPRSEGGISFFATPFAGRRLITPAPNGAFAVAWSEFYRIAILTPSGDTLRVIERDYSPLPVTDDQWQTATSDYRSFREEWPGSRCDPDGMTRPEYQQALQGLYFDAAGRLVVEVTADGSVRYDFYDQDGRAVSTVLAPERDESVTPYFRGTQILQVRQDSLGVQFVTLVRSTN